MTDTEIHIGVTADPGAAAAPGLEQEFFDTADGFSKWCNAAGGINGRKIVIDKLDAKLFNVGQVMTNACQKDFMLVGNGNAFDSAGVKVREGCKLGQIPAYVDLAAGGERARYQVQATPVPPTQINDGALRLLADRVPRRPRPAGVGIGRQQPGLAHPDRPEGAGVPEGPRHQGRRCCRSSRRWSTTTGPTWSR